MNTSIPLVCLAVLLPLTSWLPRTSHADEPAVDAFPLPKDVKAVVPTEVNPRILDQINRALDGKPSDASGDEIMQGVLESIRRRGSVLDGSVLDTPPDGNSQQVIDESPREHSLLVKAAHSLLRSAKLLESLEEKRSAEHRDLVIQLRRRAVTLLLQTLPPEVDAPPQP